MTLGWLDAVGIVATPIVLGHATLRAIGIGRDTDRMAWAAWAYTVGSLVQGAWTLVWYALDKPGPGSWLWPSMMAAGAVATALLRRRPRAPAAAAAVDPGRGAALVVVAVLALAIVDRATAGNAVPIALGDGAAIWTAKAKVMFTTGGFGQAFRDDAELCVLHPDYPLLNPLLQLVVFEHLGALSHVDSRLPIEGFGPALLLAIVAALRRFVPSLAAALMAALIVGAGVVVPLLGDTYADHMVMLGLLVLVDGWLRWRETGERAYWRLAMLAATFTVASKNEGSMLVLVVAFAVTVARATGAVATALPALRRGGAWLVLPLAVAVGQHLLNAAVGFSSDLFDTSGGAASFGERLAGNFTERAPRVGEYFATEVVLGAQQTRLVFLLLVLTAVLRPRRALTTAAAVPLWSVGGALAVYALVFVATYWELESHLGSAAVRVAMHVGPLALLGTAMIISGRPSRGS